MINRRIFHEVYLPQSSCQIKRRNLKAKYISIDNVVWLAWISMSSRAEIKSRRTFIVRRMRFDESCSFLNINVMFSVPSWYSFRSQSYGNQNPNIFTSDRTQWNIVRINQPAPRSRNKLLWWFGKSLRKIHCAQNIIFSIILTIILTETWNFTH